MIKVDIHSVNHNHQRYDTAGDWYFHNDGETIRVSDMDNWKYEMLLAVHELIEYIACTNEGISEEVVTDFDLSFIGDEPGDSKDAPYHDQHKFATKIEKLLAKRLDVDWKLYDKAVQSLEWRKK